MSIMIKGMVMPTDQPQLLWVYPNGKALTVQSDVDPWKDLQAVPVPPHGRLIDADAIPYKKIMYEDDEFYYGVTKPYIDRMPTVIPADKDGEI